MDSVLPRELDWERRVNENTLAWWINKTWRRTRVFKVIGDAHPTVRGRFQFEKLIELVDIIGNDLLCECGEFLADLERSHRRRGNIIEVGLVFE